MIIGMVTIAVAIVCVFLYVSKPKQTNKSSQSYLNGVDVDKLQKKVGKDFEGTYLLKDYVEKRYLCTKVNMDQQKQIRCKVTTLY